MRILDKCVVCNRKVSQLFDLGELYNSAYVNNPNEKEIFKPVKTIVNWCKNCKNMQSNYVEDGESMFRDYYYRSATNQEMIRQLNDIVTSRHVSDAYLFNDDENFNWLDIAANDNTLLKLVKDNYDGSFTVGIDPSKIENREPSDVFINDFFSAQKVEEQVKEQFNIITCIAMMYDIEKIHEFIDDVKKLLKDDGVFIVQLMDLESRLKTYAIDDLCNEHIVCYSLECLVKLFKEHDMDIFDCEYNKTNCSSLRLYICHKGQQDIRENVAQTVLFQSEHFNADYMVKWCEKVKSKLVSVKNFIKWMKNNDRKVVLIGASTKATTLLQVAELDSELINCATELSDFKFNKYMMASGIPIVSEKEFLAQNDGKNVVYLIAIWAFKEGIVKNYQEHLNNGAIIVVPFPTPHVVEKNGEFQL